MVPFLEHAVGRPEACGFQEAENRHVLENSAAVEDQIELRIQRNVS